MARNTDCHSTLSLAQRGQVAAGRHPEAVVPRKRSADTEIPTLVPICVTDHADLHPISNDPVNRYSSVVAPPGILIYHDYKPPAELIAARNESRKVFKFDINAPPWKRRHAQGGFSTSDVENINPTMATSTFLTAGTPASAATNMFTDRWNDDREAAAVELQMVRALTPTHCFASPN